MLILAVSAMQNVVVVVRFWPKMRILFLVAVASFLGCLGPKSQGPAMDQNRGFREVAPPDEAEQHAQRSQLTMNKTGKRSYQRACKVALAKGAALYKGRLLTAQALGAHEDQFAVSEKPEKQSFQPIRQYHHKFEIEVLSWNAGSITSRVWNELLAILATPEYQNIKLVLLQESHWQQDQTYSSGPWSVLTCGSESDIKPASLSLCIDPWPSSQRFAAPP